MTEKPPGSVPGARVLLIAASTVVVIFGLREAKSIVIPFLIATFLSILCAPPVVWLQRRRVPSILAVLLVVILMLGILAGATTLVSGSLQAFSEALPRYQMRLDGLGTTIFSWLDERGFGLEQLEAHVKEAVRPGSVMELLRRGLAGFFAAFSNTLFVFLTVIFMLLEAAGLPVKLRAALGKPDADLQRFSNAAREIQKYLGIKTVISLVTGSLIGIWVAIVGLDLALAWGFLAFVLNYIPNIGSMIAAVPAVLLAAVQLGFTQALLVAGGFVVVNVVLGNFVEPQLMGRTLGMSTLVVFLSLVFWGWVFGPVGMLLSVPLTMIIKIVLENSQDLQWIAVLLDTGGAAAEKLDQVEGKKAKKIILPKDDQREP
jgi:predicted PurR-regulated permease PerM